MTHKKICVGCGVGFETNNNRTRFCTNLCSKTGVNSHRWKGDAVGIDALHTYVRKNLPKPAKCQSCGEAEPYDLANISQEYKRDLSDWEWLCRKCHMIKDGRLNTLLTHHPKLGSKECLECGSVFKPHNQASKFCSSPCFGKYYFKLRKRSPTGQLL